MTERDVPDIVKGSYWYLAAQLQSAENPIQVLFDNNIPFPKSIGLIADGNGRWAEQHRLPVTEGHKAGAKKILQLLSVCQTLPIDTVVLWLMSPDNFSKRDPAEVAGLMEVIKKYLPALTLEFQKTNTRFIHLGRKEGIPKDVVNVLVAAETITEKNTGQRVMAAINFCGSAENIDGIREAIMADRAERLPSLEDAALEQYTDPYRRGELDMVIRTGGDQRTSGIGSIAAYSEWFNPHTLMPDCSVHELAEAFLEFALVRDRRFGRRPQTVQKR